MSQMIVDENCKIKNVIRVNFKNIFKQSILIIYKELQ